MGNVQNMQPVRECTKYAACAGYVTNVKYVPEMYNICNMYRIVSNLVHSSDHDSKNGHTCIYLENINLILAFIINIISQPNELLNISSAFIV